MSIAETSLLMTVPSVVGLSLEKENLNPTEFQEDLHMHPWLVAYTCGFGACLDIQIWPSFLQNSCSYKI